MLLAGTAVSPLGGYGGRLRGTAWPRRRRLRRQAEDLRAQLAAVEERLQRLAITRETLTEFTGEYLGDADMTEGDDAGAEEESSEVAHLDPAKEPSPLPPLAGVPAAGGGVAGHGR